MTAPKKLAQTNLNAIKAALKLAEQYSELIKINLFMDQIGAAAQYAEMAEREYYSIATILRSKE